MRSRPRALAVLAGVLALLAAPAPALGRDIGADDEFVITGTVRVPVGEHADRIVIGDGRVLVDGHVDGVIIALDAPVRISGVVDGDVIALGRRVTLTRSAILNGDLLYGDKKPVVPRGATVYGDVRHLSPRDFSFPFAAFLVHAAIWLAVTVSSLALGLLLLWVAPRVADSALIAARERPGPAIGWGVALFLGLPVVALVAVLTLVGIPLGLVLLLALLPLYALGYVTAAYVFGRQLVGEPRGRVPAFLAGWAILRALAFVPVLGAFIWLAATVFGLGLMTVAAWRSREAPPSVVPSSS